MLTFGDDLEFLRQHNDVILLASGNAQVAVVAAYQGRVMTSTSGGLGGLSFGWLNYEHIAASERVPHINVFGGEDRFWLGPGRRPVLDLLQGRRRLRPRALANARAYRLGRVGLDRGRSDACALPKKPSSS